MERRVVHSIPVNLAVIEVVVDFLGVRGWDVICCSPYSGRAFQMCELVALINARLCI